MHTRFIAETPTGTQLEHLFEMLAAVTGDSVQRDPETNEVWQYMGSLEQRNNEGKITKWSHEFRHRCHPSTSARVYVHILQHNTPPQEATP